MFFSCLRRRDRRAVTIAMKFIFTRNISSLAVQFPGLDKDRGVPHAEKLSPKAFGVHSSS